ncbi:MAG: glycosyltransferase [Planctomycetaceae bacterium]
MISFIVPAYNEEQLLGPTLRAIQSATTGLTEPYEIIVADDASTDGTAAEGAACGARIVSVNHRQIAATRNAGARAAHGTLLIFVDADTLVTPQAVQAAVAAIRNGAIGGGCAFRFDGRVPLYARLLAGIAMPVYRWCGLASGCFLFCTRAAFDAVGGFDERLYAAEEAAMSQALRRQGRFVILRESVTTSARKLRTHSMREVLGTLLRIGLTGPRSVRTREGLDIWYGDRRSDDE